MMKSSVAVLTSGGFDSNVLVAQLLKGYERVYPLYIQFGFFWEKAEIFWLKKFLRALPNKKIKPLTLLQFPFVDIDPKAWALTGKKVPGYKARHDSDFLLGRNLLLLSKASTFCAAKKIPALALGTLKTNPFPDASPQFFRDIEKVASTALAFKVKILTPFRKLTKEEVLKKGKDLPLHLSFSCIAPQGRQPCRNCIKCAEREENLKKVTG